MSPLGFGEFVREGALEAATLDFERMTGKARGPGRCVRIASRCGASVDDASFADK
jgi:hypothetical protein